MVTRTIDPIAVDFETEAIVGSTIMNPPKPVGVAVWYPGCEDQLYLTGDTMERVCKSLWYSDYPLLFHNAPFDLCVAEKWLGLPFPRWELIHDTQYLVFLKNPHAMSLGLKQSAELYLDLPPDEQTDLKAWILANVPEATEKTFGAYICKAPVELVAPYAKGDVLRTRMLFDHLYPQIPQEPYDRERELMPIMVNSTRHGVRCNRKALAATYEASVAAQRQCEQLIRTKLGAPGLNPHSGPELAKALDAAGAMSQWVLTPTGRKSTKRENLMAGIEDQELLNLLVYTGAMQTAIGTFMGPWLDMSAEDGRLHPNWNQTRTTHGGNSKGTRTGRLSSDDPNFFNVPNPFTFAIPDGLVPMPNLRDFILPEPGHVWLKRDWKAQEMRILAHFEDGALFEQYNLNPDMDVHDTVADMINAKIGKRFTRKFIKETGFGMIYGMGAPGLAKKLGCTTAESREVMDAYRLVLPGVGILQGETKKRGRNGLPITTWGGREYYAEEPKIVKGSYRSFEYKLTNYLIQGSAADQCKQCTIDWHNGHGAHSQFMTTVYDEFNISADIGHEVECMEWLKECMNQDYFDVPMRSDSLKGPSWGQIEPWEY